MLKGFVLMKIQLHCQVIIQVIKQTAQMHRLTEYWTLTLTEE